MRRYDPPSTPYPGVLLATGTEDMFLSSYYFDAGKARRAMARGKVLVLEPGVGRATSTAPCTARLNRASLPPPPTRNPHATHPRLQFFLESAGYTVNQQPAGRGWRGAMYRVFDRDPLPFSGEGRAEQDARQPQPFCEGSRGGAAAGRRPFSFHPPLQTASSSRGASATQPTRPAPSASCRCAWEGIGSCLCSGGCGCRYAAPPCPPCCKQTGGTPAGSPQTSDVLAYSWVYTW